MYVPRCKNVQGSLQEWAILIALAMSEWGGAAKRTCGIHAPEPVDDARHVEEVSTFECEGCPRVCIGLQANRTCVHFAGVRGRINILLASISHICIGVHLMPFGADASTQACTVSDPVSKP
jgi:hypothetical protein